jgi:RNA polymerase sigma-70 factor, ECF subfamily
MGPVPAGHAFPADLTPASQACSFAWVDGHHPGGSAHAQLLVAAVPAHGHPAAGRAVIGASFHQVIAGAAAGDEGSFAVIWRDLQPALLRYLRVVVRDAAEDVASDTWVDVVQRLDRFRGDERGFRAWVFTIARHRALDWGRHAARNQAMPMPVELLTDLEARDDPAAAAVETLSTQAALALLADLPRAQAEVLLLRLVVGLDVGEVAGIVGKRPGAVRVLAHRGLRRLAERLGAEVPVRGGVTP